MPAEITLKKVDTLRRNGMCNNHRRLTIDCLRFSYSIVECAHIVPIHLLYIPIKGFEFFAKWLERHNIFRVAVNLDTIPIYNHNEIIELLFSALKKLLPNLPTIKLTVAR